MKLQRNICICIITLMTVQSHAKDLHSSLDLKQQLRPNSFLEWIIAIFNPTQSPATESEVTPETTVLKECVPCTCGTPNNMSRIVGGEETQPLQYPWMTLLSKDDRDICAGTLISDSYVVTSAECLNGVTPSSIRLLVHDRSQNSMQEIQKRVSGAKKHPDYNSNTKRNDIGLVRLAEPVDFSDMLRPVCMPSSTETYDDEMGIATGWGATSEDGEKVDKLMQVSLPILSDEKCVEKYDDNRITEQMICAGYDEGGKDVCYGDAGGPLTVYSNAYHLVGIVSWGTGCARPNKPSVFTRVSEYLDWIKSNSENDCKCEEPTKKLN